MTELPNLNHLDNLNRGEQPPAEQPAPDDITTAARIDWIAAGIAQEVTP